VAEELTLPLPEPHIGSDEAGKGDYFGYLVVAAVAVTPELAAELTRLGVKDSKHLSDRRAAELAQLVRMICPHEVVRISPARYNQLYQELGNLNLLLAWGHARAIENLIARVPVPVILSDQFGDPHYIERSLMQHGRQARLLQTPRAERDPAVAAASVLARDVFLATLARLGRQVGVQLPKGAAHVLPTARRLLAQGGPEVLGQVAKLHFRTTKQALAGE
jgi:ribonuclease HIII